MQGERIKFATLSLLCVAALTLVGCAARSADDRRASRATLEAMSSILAQREDTLRQLQSTPPTGASVGAAESYLNDVRRDGVGRHAETKRKLDSVAANTVALVTLIDVYEPQAKTAGFRTEAQRFRAYALVWMDRWNGVFETFMLGGRLPSADPLYPEAFSAAIKAELDAIK